MLSSDSQRQFLIQILQAVSDSNANPQVVYPLLQANLDKLDIHFAEVLRDYATTSITKMEESQKILLANDIGNFGNLIRNFKLGEHSSNIELSIEAYHIVEAIFTHEAFPEKWALTQSNLGIAYFRRIQGKRLVNLELAIAHSQQALLVYTYEAFPKQATAIEQAIENWQSLCIDIYKYPKLLANIENNMGHPLKTFLSFIRNQVTWLLLKALMLYQHTIMLLGVLFVLPIFIVLKFLPLIWLALVLLLLSPLFLIVYLSLVLRAFSLTRSISFSITLVTASMWTLIAKKHDELYKKAVHKDKLISTFNVKLLNKAILAYERLSQHPKFAETTLLTIGDRLDFFDHLAKFHFNRHEVTGQEQDLKRAIELYQQVVNLTPSIFSNKSKYLVSLGLTLQYYYLYLKQRDVHVSKVESLVQAINSLQQAVDLVPNDSPSKAIYLYYLSIAKYYHYKQFSSIVDLEQTIDLRQQAVDLTLDNSPDKALYLDELGEVLTHRYQELTDLTDLQQAIVLRKQSFDLTSEKSFDEKTMYLYHFATNLYMRHIHTGEAKDLQQALEYYRQGAKKGNLDCARNWLNLVFTKQIWQEVIDAYGYLFQTNQKLFAIELIRERKESKLREVQGLASKVAYAFLKQGRLSQATETLEHSSARLLSENLMRKRPNAGFIDKNMFVRVLGQIFHLFKRVGDFYGFDYPSNFLTIAQASRDTPLVYISVTEVGGFALVVQEPEVGFRVPLITKIPAIVRFSSTVFYKLKDKMSGGSSIEPDQAVTPVYLPLLTETALNEKMVMPKNEQEIAGYFANYILRRENPKSESLFNNWRLALEEITEWLWQAVMQPILEVLPQDCQRITLIPTGRLNLLPLHAAWTKDDNMPTGKRYALDRLTIGYAPNAYSLIESRKTALRVTASKLLAIDEPKPVKANPLPSSGVEVHAIAQHFTQPQLLRHDAATQETVKNTLNPAIPARYKKVV